MEKKRYIIAPKRAGAKPPPADWKERVSAIEGVVVLGSTRNQVQFLADENAIAKVHDQLGDLCFIEEAIQRNPMAGSKEGGETL